MIRSHSQSHRAWIVWFVASLFYAYQYILRVMPNVMLDDIMQRFDMSAAIFGQFSGIYYVGYSLMHLPIGILLDRLGPRKVMAVCILLTAFGLLPLVYAEHWIFPTLGRALIGIGSSAAILGVFKIIRMTFSEKVFPRMLSISVTIGLIGAIYGGGPVDYLKEAFGYEVVVKLLALTGVFLAFVTYFVVPEHTSREKQTLLADVLEVLGQPKVLFACIFAGLMVGPLEGFADVWGSVFFKHVYGFEGALAASLPSLIFIGMCFGSPLLSLIAEKTGSFLAVIFGSSLVMAFVFFSLLLQSLSISVISAGFLIVGICSAYQILAIYKISTYVRENVAGLATAVANMIIMTFGYAFHGAIGAVVNALGGTTSSHALLLGIVVIPVALCLGGAGFLYLYIREKAAKLSSYLIEK